MAESITRSKHGRKARKPGLVSVYNDNISIIESLIMTRAQWGGNIYRQRFLLRLVALAQKQVRMNMSVVLGSSKIFFSDNEIPELEIPVRDLINGFDDRHFSRAKDAINSFASWYLYFENEKEIVTRPVLLKCRLDKDGEIFHFRMEPDIWRSMFDFSRGFNVYNLSVALSLENELALKIFKGLEKSKGMYYTFDSFRSSFGFTKRFVGRNSDLVRDMIEPARKELNAKSPWSFKYDLDIGYPKGKNRGRKSLLGITVTPVRMYKNDRFGGVKDEIHPSHVIGLEPWRILNQKLEFTITQVRSNLDIFKLAYTVLGETAFADWLDSIVPSAVRAEKSVQGYIVNALKLYLERKSTALSEGVVPVQDKTCCSVLPPVCPVRPVKGNCGSDMYGVGDLFSTLGLDF